jgi:hypothetical protein
MCLKRMKKNLNFRSLLSLGLRTLITLASIKHTKPFYFFDTLSLVGLLFFTIFFVL